MIPFVCSGSNPVSLTGSAYDSETLYGCGGVNVLGAPPTPSLTYYYRDGGSTYNPRVNSQISVINASVPASGTITLRDLAGTTSTGIKLDTHSLQVTIATGDTSISTVVFSVLGSDYNTVGTSTFYTGNAIGSITSTSPSNNWKIPWTSGYGSGIAGRNYNVKAIKTAGTHIPTGSAVNTFILLDTAQGASWKLQGSHAAGPKSCTLRIELWDIDLITVVSTTNVSLTILTQ